MSVLPPIDTSRPPRQSSAGANRTEQLRAAKRQSRPSSVSTSRSQSRNSLHLAGTSRSSSRRVTLRSPRDDPLLQVGGGDLGENADVDEVPDPRADLVASCRQVREWAEQLQQQTMRPVWDMSYHQELTLDDWHLLAYSVERNTSLRSWTIASMPEDEFTNQHTEVVCNALKKNRHLERLELDGNRLRTRGAQLVADLLANNKHINHVSIQHCQIDDQGMEHVLDALLPKINTTHMGFQEPEPLNRTLMSIFVANNAISPVVEQKWKTMLSEDISDGGRPEIIADAFYPHDLKVFPHGPGYNKLELKWRKTPFRDRLQKIPASIWRFWDAVSNNRLKRVEKFIKEGGDIFQWHPEGYQAMHIAAHHGHGAMVNLLAKHGADCRTRLMCDLGGRPEWYQDAVMAVIEAKEDNPKKSGSKAASRPASARSRRPGSGKNGDEPPRIAAKRFIFTRLSRGANSLHLACRGNHLGAVDALCKIHCDVNAVDRLGNRPVVYTDHPVIHKLLVENGSGLKKIPSNFQDKKKKRKGRSKKKSRKGRSRTR